MTKTLGKDYESRELSKKVRDLALEKILLNLQGKEGSKDKRFQQALLLKLAGSVLPRLNEISGPDGGDIPLPLLGGKSNVSNSNNSNKKTAGTKKED